MCSTCEVGCGLPAAAGRQQRQGSAAVHCTATSARWQLSTLALRARHAGAADAPGRLHPRPFRCASCRRRFLFKATLPASVIMGLGLKTDLYSESGGIRSGRGGRGSGCWGHQLCPCRRASQAAALRGCKALAQRRAVCLRVRARAALRCARMPALQADGIFVPPCWQANKSGALWAPSW